MSMGVTRPQLLDTKLCVCRACCAGAQHDCVASTGRGHGRKRVATATSLQLIHPLMHGWLRLSERAVFERVRGRSFCRLSILLLLRDGLFACSPGAGGAALLSRASTRGVMRGFVLLWLLVCLCVLFIACSWLWEGGKEGVREGREAHFMRGAVCTNSPCAAATQQ